MKGFFGVRDNDWSAFLSEQSRIDEANFWQPGGGRISCAGPRIYALTRILTIAWFSISHLYGSSSL